MSGRAAVLVCALVLAGCGEYERPVTYCAEEDRDLMRETYLRCVDHIGGDTALQSLEEIDLAYVIAECGTQARLAVCTRQGWRTWAPGHASWIDHPTPERKRRSP